MNEQSKSARRRYNDGAFHSRYFVGVGLDIGAGSDSVGNYINDFPRIESVYAWDVHDGDAQKLAGLAPNTIDFIHSSHCLEHLVDPAQALSNWLRVLKPGGHLIVTVPDEDMYERGNWPSHFNSDHKHTFTIQKFQSWSPVSINVLDLAMHFCTTASVERITRLADFFNPKTPGDQTLRANPECSIEFIWRKL